MTLFPFALNFWLIVAAGLLGPAALVADGGLAAVRTRSQQEAPVDTLQEAPAAIPLSDIVQRSQETSARLREIWSISRPDPDVARVESALAAVSESFAQLSDEFDLSQAGELSARRLRDAKSAWLREGAQLEAWKSTLERRLGELGTVAEELRVIREQWETTQRAGAEAPYPAALRQVIASVLAEVEAAEDEAQAALSATLTLDTQAANQLAALRDSVDRIDAAREAVARRLFRPNAPPLWQGYRAQPVDVPFAQRVREARREKTAILTEYMRRNGNRGLLQALLFVLVLSSTLALRRRSQRWAMDDEALRASAQVLAHPYSSAVVVALVFTPWIYPRVPSVVYDLALLVLLVPLLRLLSTLIGTRVRTALYALGGLYVLQLVRGILPDDWLLHRLVLLLETGVAFAALAWLVRSTTATGETEPNRFWRAVLILGRTGLVVFSVALVANVLGFVALASLLTEATLRSAYVAIVLLTAAQVMAGVVTAAVRTPTAQAIGSVRVHADRLTRRARMVVGIAAVLVWLWATLRMFGVSDLVWSAVAAVLGREWLFGSVAISLGDLVAFGVSLWVAVLLSRLIRALLEQDVLTRVEVPRGVSVSISRLAHYAILTIGLLFAFAAAGIDLSSLTIVVGALGVGIGFGLQNIVNNFISGLILIFERPIRVGDAIEIESLLGTVKQIGIRASRVRTFDGAEVIVPNGDLISGRVVNWTLSDRLRRIDVAVGVKYGTDPKRVLEILKSVARSVPEVLSDPEPLALFLAHGDSSLDFMLRFWTPNFESWWTVKSAVTVAVNQAIKEAGIEIPFPQRDLHLRSVDPAIGLPGLAAAGPGEQDAGGKTPREKRSDSG